MITILFLGVAILTAQKVFGDVRVRPPFEWVGELFAVVVAFTVAAVPSLALHLLVF